MKLLTKILIKELFKCWPAWDLHRDYYLYELFPGLIEGSIPTDLANEEELISLIRKVAGTKGWNISDDEMDDIIAGDYSLTDIESKISLGEFDKADTIYDQTKGLSINKFSPSGYESLKNSFRQKTIGQVDQLLRQYKFNEAGNLYSKHTEILKKLNFIGLEKEYLKKQLAEKKRIRTESSQAKVNEVNRLLEQYKFAEAEVLYQKHSEDILGYNFKNSKEEYIRRQQGEEVLTQLKRLINRSNFIEADRLFTNEERLLFQVGFNNDGYSSLKESVYINFQKNRVAIDEYQAKAIVSDFKNLLIAARAGSGKTSTLANKLHYLTHFYGVDANSVMTMSFNKNAKEEIASRVRTTGITNYNNARTFHSLAYSIVNKVNGVGELLLDEKEMEVEKKLSNFIQDIVKEKLSIFENRQSLYDDFYKEISELEEEEYSPRFSSIKHYDEIRRKFMEVTLKGDYVKSWGEKYIADFLFENGVNYEYEKYFDWDNKPYHPDFTIQNESQEPRLIIEYWGLRYSQDPSYRKQIEQKQLYWKSKNIRLIGIDPGQVRGKREGFEKMLASLLISNGISVNPKDKQELIETTIKRNIARITSNVKQFIQKAQKSMLSLDEIQTKVEAIDNKRSRTFNRFAFSVLSEYLARLESQKETDFDCLMKDAIKIINEQNGDIEIPLGKSGKSINLMNLKYLFLDEYQDFSKLFYCLVQSLRSYNKNLKIVAVGDDWQAINGFAGSDLYYFENFSKLFDNGNDNKHRNNKLYLLNNYRSYSEIVNFSNRFMEKFEFDGKPSKAYNLKKGLIKKIPLYNGRGRLNQDSVQIIAKNILDAFIRYYPDNTGDILGKTARPIVLVLTRKSKELRNDTLKIQDALKLLIMKNHPNLRKLVYSRLFANLITFKTIHKSKGEEADVVFILDVNDNDFPLMHPDSSLFEMFGVTAEKVLTEEIRLFYVAITRAKKELCIFYRNRCKSSFVL